MLLFFVLFCSLCASFRHHKVFSCSHGHFLLILCVISIEHLASCVIIIQKFIFDSLSSHFTRICCQIFIYKYHRNNCWNGYKTMRYHLRIRLSILVLIYHDKSLASAYQEHFTITNPSKWNWQVKYLMGPKITCWLVQWVGVSL